MCFSKIWDSGTSQNCNVQHDDKLWDFGRCSNLTKPDHSQAAILHCHPWLHRRWPSARRCRFFSASTLKWINTLATSHGSNLTEKDSRCNWPVAWIRIKRIQEPLFEWWFQPESPKSILFCHCAAPPGRAAHSGQLDVAASAQKGWPGAGWGRQMVLTVHLGIDWTHPKDIRKTGLGYQNVVGRQS